MNRSRDDELLFAQLHHALATADPVPELVIDSAKASWAWRRADEELAELVTDSVMQPPGPVRSAGHPTEPRLLTFDGPGLTVEVEITPVGDMHRLVGQLVPPRRGDVEVRWQGGSVRSEADSIGLFSADSVPAGPISIACRPAGEERQVVTSWVTI